jgi:hypothetical protein
MPKPSLPAPEEPSEQLSPEVDLEPDVLDDLPEDGPPPAAPPRRSITPLKIAAAVAALLVLGGALMAYRSHVRRKALRDGLERAEQLLRLDTAAGYGEAAALLEPLAELDPIEAASARAFALAMLFCDYRAGRAEAEAEALLIRPGRAAEIPRHASLARAALRLGRRSLGDATVAAGAAQGSPWAEVLQARIALAAGALQAAVEPAGAAAAARLPAGLAVNGDVLRRARHDPAGARAAYAAALAGSPSSPRPAYGLAKLALAGDAPPAEAEGPLRRLVADRATPAPERARAALHLAALRLRTGDRPGASDALDAAHLEPAARAWAERAVAVTTARSGPYRAVSGAPASLQSASDDDPPELSPSPPEPPPAPRAAAPAPRPAAKKAAVRAPAKRPAQTAAAAAHHASRSKASAQKATTARTAAKKKAVKKTARP